MTLKRFQQYKETARSTMGFLYELKTAIIVFMGSSTFVNANANYVENLQRKCVSSVSMPLNGNFSWQNKFRSTRPTFSSCVSDQERDLWASVLSRISRRIWNITSESSRRRNGWKATVSVGGTGGGKAENEKMFFCVLSGKKLKASSRWASYQWTLFPTLVLI